MKIVFHGGNAANFHAGFADILGPGHEIHLLPDRIETEADRQVFVTADVIVGVKLSKDDPFPAALRLYHAPAAGTDAIDRACLPPGATLCNAFGHENAIAEYVMTALLQRHVPLARADARLREGHWDFWAGRAGALRTELGSCTIGLLGFGHIGKTIAARAKAFGMAVTVCNRSPVAVNETVTRSFSLNELPAFMGSADYIVVSLPLIEETRGIVDAPALAAMRADGVIINVGRGPVIDEEALFEALRSSRIGGAIIDTWYVYPTPETPDIAPSRFDFRSLSNVLMTPHMSGWTNGTIRRRQETVAENIRRLGNGLALLNVV